jgi:hypothetical protein
MKFIGFLFLFTFYSLSAKCANDSLSNFVLSNLVNVNNKIFTPQLDSAVYIIATTRSCNKCFQDVCDMYGNLPVYIICYMPKDLTGMITNYSRYMSIANRVKDVYFLWTDKTGNEQLKVSNNQPSPQLIIVKSKNREYYSYSKFLKIYSK